MISQQDTQLLTQILITGVHRSKIKGSFSIAKSTAEILRKIVTQHSSKKGDTTQQLIHCVKSAGAIMQDAFPQLLIIGNIVRRILYIIREEHVQKQTNQDDVDVYHERNLQHLVGDNLKHEIDLNTSLEIKKEVIESIQGLIQELEVLEDDTMVERIEQHIHSGEVVLTVGLSHSVQYFLETASKKNLDFKLIVTEHAPSKDGHTMAEALGSQGIKTTLISDAAMFSVMSRVNKVIVGAHAILANGGLIAPCGTHMVALAAKKHSVPFVVVTGLYKLSPLYPVDQNSFNNMYNPGDVLPFSEIHSKNIHVYNPAIDYVPPELVDLFITNNGVHSPTYIYRLLAEYYDPIDYDLSINDSEDEEVSESDIDSQIDEFKGVTITSS
mmetsp:Transcript_8838/g.32639  ORF Transcript_8838/g.32639 Transcript_8838/m.32639 type:complete len:383 (-) Transcript_8838:42-1190(-)|eukprot:CAMPEP_0117441920 /NCGR_PEP_ID=MMETSP0759-20121206/3882_1 /TAXON_ID=63605 /ORGANISM="Percolomonas cosmopolitus, Strain WS" /LENGTH=382 /DNA_ID=CAMNT_0005233787 /DNA_START=104 /DNA_END=1252 /DNA_ORIENTATION=+